MNGRRLKLMDRNENEWELNELLFADDTVVVEDSEEKLCQNLEGCVRGGSCE